MFQYLVPLALISLLVIPFGIPVLLVLNAEGDGARALSVLSFPIIFVTLYTGVCIAFARLGQAAIIPGRFPRSVTHPVYGRRRLYGMMWTAIYYFKPLYWLLLSTRTSKLILLRGFGYRGSIDIVNYPDTWMRDLPLLELSEGAYLANKATIGTNMCLSDGSILVDRIKIGKGTVIGHLGMLAPGVEIGDHSETGSGSAVGMGVKLGNRVSLGPQCLVNHGAKIADDVKVGAAAYVGIKAEIRLQNALIPPFSSVPDYSIVDTEDDLRRVLSERRFDGPLVRGVSP